MTSLVTSLLLLSSIIRPDAASKAQYRQPQLATGHGMVAMTFGSTGEIWFALSKDNGRTFNSPVRVAQTGALALGRHRAPRAVILKDAILVTAIVAPKVATNTHAHGLPEDGNLTVWRSTDQGRTWKQGPVINDVPGATREGLHAIEAAPDGTLYTVWLDSRTEGMKLYGASSKDGGATWSKNVQVYSSPDGTICSCCHPSLHIDDTGRIRIMWRNVIDGNRDLYITESTDGVHFTAPRKQGAGTWKINACPMDGGGFYVGSNGKITSAWRRQSEIYLSTEGQPEVSLGAGKDVAIVRSKQGPVLAWTQETAIVIKTPGDAAPRTIAAKGGFVSLTALPDGALLAAWENEGAIETQRID